MSHELRVGVIGFGWMGQAHSRSYRALPSRFGDRDITPVLAAVCDPVEERRAEALANFGFAEAHADWRDLIARDDLDIIDITAPNGMHRDLAVAAAESGKHVFCEKPVGLTLADTAAIEAAARQAGVVSGCGYNYRWTPLVQHLKTLIDEGRLGALTHYRGRFFSMYGRDRLGLLSWRFKQDEAGYGSLLDLMCHAVDMALHLAGPITRLTATKETFVKQRPLPKPGEGTHYDRGAPGDPTGPVTNEDYVGALVEFAGGARGTLEVDRSIFGPQSAMAFELNGERGAASWDHETLNQMDLYLPEESPADGYQRVLAGDWLPHHGNFVPGYGNSLGYEDLKGIEAAEFCTAVAEGRPFEPGFGAALRVARVLDAMIRSFDSGGWEDVDLSEPGQDSAGHDSAGHDGAGHDSDGGST
ncbi:Gfo/Idh/MocA family protein [Euzebya tangerina]|uniref:Gfo/Idh/MocA family protein n=1 Tax=Euzebya tangerina TaxID=591198 RepID=UPI000E3168CF|nr:Gfo/Idh/MocA family oxidoreductase [Euzebya tangerina]